MEPDFRAVSEVAAVVLTLALLGQTSDDALSRLLRTLAYVRPLADGSGALTVGLFEKRPDSAPPIGVGKRAVQLVDCGDVSCGDRAVQVVVLPDGWSRAEVDEVLDAFRSSTTLVVGSRAQHAAWGAALAVDGEARVTVNRGQLALGRLSLEPALLRRVLLVDTLERPAVPLPEGASPPQPDPTNVAPEYPPAARIEGKEGVVVLRLAVSVTEAVSDVSVQSGQPPFTDAAVAAAKRWRFTPAVHEGAPLAVYKVIKVPFRLR